MFLFQLTILVHKMLIKMILFEINLFDCLTLLCLEKGENEAHMQIKMMLNIKINNYIVV